MARTGRPTASLTLTSDEQDILRRYIRRGKTSQQLALRSRIVLECAKGQDNQRVATILGVNAKTVGKWRARFFAERLDGLTDSHRTGAPRQIGDDKVEEIIVATLDLNH
jgi:transposase